MQTKQPQPLDKHVTSRDLAATKEAMVLIANHSLELHLRAVEFLEGRGSRDDLRMADQELAHLNAYMPFIHKAFANRETFDAGYKAGAVDASKELPQIQAHLSMLMQGVVMVPVFKRGGAGKQQHE